MATIDENSKLAVLSVLDYLVFRLYSKLNYNTENDEKTAFSD